MNSLNLFGQTIKFNGIPEANLLLGNMFEEYHGIRHLGKRQGLGTLNADNFDYSGEFERGKFNNYGTLTRQGCIYEGKFECGNITYGTLKTEKFIYTGEFLDYQIHGQGLIEFNHPHTIVYYKGQFKKGEYNGIGEYLDSNGFIHRGTFENNKKCGEFLITCPTGQIIRSLFVYHNVSKVEILSNDVFHVAQELDSLALQDVFKFYQSTLMLLYADVSYPNKWMKKSQLYQYMKKFKFQVTLDTANGQYVLPFQFVEIVCRIAILEYPRQVEKFDTATSLHYFLRYSRA